MTAGKAIGFGFVPAESRHHFVVTLPRLEDGTVEVVEHFAYDAGSIEQGSPDPAQREPRKKVEIGMSKWQRVAEEVRVEFNRRLRQREFKAGSWKAGDNLLAAHFGKELVLLLWALEDADPSLSQAIYQNWEGLAPEERWWLYTTVNAATGHWQHGRNIGWRKAIRIAFSENPVAGRAARSYEDEREAAALLPTSPQARPKRKGRKKAEQASYPDLFEEEQ